MSKLVVICCTVLLLALIKYWTPVMEHSLQLRTLEALVELKKGMKPKLEHL